MYAHAAVPFISQEQMRGPADGSAFNISRSTRLRRTLACGRDERPRQYDLIQQRPTKRKTADLLLSAGGNVMRWIGIISRVLAHANRIKNSCWRQVMTSSVLIASALDLNRGIL